MDMERYQRRRQALIEKHRKKKAKALMVILGLALGVALATLLICGKDPRRLPFLGVILVADLMMTVIYLTMRLVALNHRKELELRRFEEEELVSPFHKM
ncbi:MAG: hypothetical protein IJN80_07275 [Clostridia bacterium]|nr:hypothetical protein [Clostridia bacterium]